MISMTVLFRTFSNLKIIFLASNDPLSAARQYQENASYILWLVPNECKKNVPSLSIASVLPFSDFPVAIARRRQYI
jgi:hypothetical protein